MLIPPDEHVLLLAERWLKLRAAPIGRNVGRARNVSN